jgi:glutamate synthase domain-containing protein 3
MLDNWDGRVGKFVKVMPHDFKRVILERAAAAAALAEAA